MTSWPSITPLIHQAGRCPAPVPGTRSQAAGSARQPAYELWDRGGPAQDRALLVHHDRQGRPVQGGCHSRGIGQLAAIWLDAEGPDPECAQELAGAGDSLRLQVGGASRIVEGFLGQRT